MSVNTFFSYFENICVVPDPPCMFRNTLLL